MKPIHLALTGAIVLVTVLVMLVATPLGERAAARRTDARDPEEAGSGATGARAASTAEGAAAAQPVAADDAGMGTGAETGPASITLRILGPGDAPAGGADVSLDRGIDALRAKVDPDGILRVHDLAPGVYDLVARHGKLAGALRFEARGARDLGTLRLADAVTIRGHVYGPRGEPLPSALVEGFRAAEGEVIRMGATTLRPARPEEAIARAGTGDDGGYELLVPAGGAFALRATAQGFAPQSREPRVYAADAPGIDFHLPAGALLEGRVVDAAQAPVAGARVLVGDAKAESLSGPDGAFTMVVESSGMDVLAALAAGYATSRQTVAPPQTNVLVVLRQGIALRLEAVDADRPGSPAAHVNVAAVHTGGITTGETDGEGRLRLEGLPAGPGGRCHVRLCLWGGGYAARVIELGPTEPVEGVVDIGIVRLTPGGVVRGQVLDRTTGDPIGGARLGTFGGLARELDGPVTAVSAQDGSFRIEGVPPGAHTLTATHPDFVSDLDLAFLRGGAGGVRLLPAGSREIVRDVELLPAESVAGVVLAPDGSFAAEATVLPVGDESATVTRLLDGPLPSTTTDGTGAFVLKGFLRGKRTKLRAYHRDHGPAESVEALVGGGEPVTLRLTEPLTIKGSVVDDGGAPIAGVCVQAGDRSATSDDSGAYLVRNPPRVPSVTFEHRDYAPQTVRVKLAVPLDLGRTVLLRGGSIAGTAVRGDGLPAASIVVHATKEPADMAPGRTTASVVTDAKGLFEIFGLVEGRYKLRTREPGEWSAEVALQTGARDARIVLLRAGKLAGRVSWRGTPVAGASVRAEGPRGGFLGWARTRGDGTFEISPLPPEDPFGVVIEHEGFRSLRLEAVRALDRTQDFALEPGAEVSGEVVDRRGRAVENAQVQVRVDGRDARTVGTGAAGAFAARGLGEGRISVRLGPSSRFPATEWMDVASGARGVRLVAIEGEKISGVVQGRAGEPLQKVSVQAIDALGRPAASAWVWQEDGNFDLAGLRPGTYTIRAQRYVTGPLPPAREVLGIEAGTKGVAIRLEE